MRACSHVHPALVPSPSTSHFNVSACMFTMVTMVKADPGISCRYFAEDLITICLIIWGVRCLDSTFLRIKYSRRSVPGFRVIPSFMVRLGTWAVVHDARSLLPASTVARRATFPLCIDTSSPVGSTDPQRVNAVPSFTISKSAHSFHRAPCRNVRKHAQ